MKEDLLQYIWNTRSFDQRCLETTDHKEIQIIDPGHWNEYSSGPDFFMARITLNHVALVGNVEIHIKSSDWNKHKHQDDEAYNNVILHVVYEDDAPLFINGKKIATIELKNKVSLHLQHKYFLLFKSTSRLNCEKLLGDNLKDSSQMHEWLDKMYRDRLHSKAEQVYELKREFSGDWEYTFILFLAQGIGAPLNQLPMTLVLKQVKLNKLKLIDKQDTMIAVVLGISGLLNSTASSDFYTEQLRNEFSWFQRKFPIEALPDSIWKKGGNRPNNQPIIKLVQLSVILHSFKNLLRQFESMVLDNKLQRLTEITTPAYWVKHFDLGKTRKVDISNLFTKGFVNHIIINSILPFFYVYWKENGEDQNNIKIEYVYRRTAFEKNRITELFSIFEIKKASAYHSQAEIHLFRNYCNQKKCLNCGIGKTILNH